MGRMGLLWLMDDRAPQAQVWMIGPPRPRLDDRAPKARNDAWEQGPLGLNNHWLEFAQ